jgi:hypothetical protein
MKKIIGTLLIIVVTMIGSQVFADTIVTPWYNDNHTTWTGWVSSNTDASGDTYGTPNFLSAQATITDGYLTRLTFQIQNGPEAVDLYKLLKPGDLFINTGRGGATDTTWDYVVNLMNSSGQSVSDNKLYSVNQSYLPGTNGYLLSYAPVDPKKGWSYSYRNDQPIGYDGGTAVPNTTVNFSGWNYNLAPGAIFQPYFEFGAHDILLGSQFTIGWTVSCANDIYFETMTNPVPEPASMLLMGSGLIGLAGWGRKKFMKKEAVVA